MLATCVKPRYQGDLDILQYLDFCRHASFDLDLFLDVCSDNKLEFNLNLASYKLYGLSFLPSVVSWL